MQVLSIYLIDNIGNKEHFGSTTSIRNAEWVKANLERLKEVGWLHSTIKEIRIEIENIVDSSNVMLCKIVSNY